MRDTEKTAWNVALAKTLLANRGFRETLLELMRKAAREARK